MALLSYRAVMQPSKIELIQAWAPEQPWFAGAAADLALLSAYRFDDPAGEVGIEALLVRTTDGVVLHIPVTYRGAPLAGGDHFLIGTTEHSALGTRWVYDAAGDPVALAAFATAALTGSPQAELFVEVDGVRESRPITAFVAGSGSASAVIAPVEVDFVQLENGVTVVDAGELRVALHRVPGSAAVLADAEHLTGTWTDQAEPLLLAEAASTL